MSIYHIIYHTDADGFCSAAIAARALTNLLHEVRFSPINYGWALPEVTDDEFVYLVDFCFQPDEEMLNFTRRLGSRLVWIDHHPTSVSLQSANPELANIAGIRTVREEGKPIAGCELTWRHFHPDKDIPQSVSYIGSWDTFRWQSEKDGHLSKEFVLGLDFRSIDPKSEEAMFLWHGLLNDRFDVLNAVAEDGKKLNQYLTKKDKVVMKTSSVECVFGGYPAIMVNALGSSEMFNGFYDPTKHKLMVAYQIKTTFLKVSLFSTHEDVHCGELAKKLGNSGPLKGGGGHKGAAGFQTNFKHFNSLVVSDD